MDFKIKIDEDQGEKKQHFSSAQVFYLMKKKLIFL